jgi:uncharacterized protein YndB with AHSA1/START domain
MSFQPDPDVIRWRIHLRVPPEVVYRYLSTDAGRAAFWAESAVEVDGSIHFDFSNGQSWQGKILEQDPPHRYSVVYYGGSITTFELVGDHRGNTDITLTDAGVPAGDRTEVTAGWVSVLMALKAAAAFGVDLRNHDPERSWDQDFVDN